ncbi:MAG: hypothetical protein KKF30_15655 [Proteobacteria bacterium]|nr:hypothetical protein [Pseudomonadota bacterium]MBU4472141.1 hypothetical protein [Pseudomonadota bacterium]MCG2752860.1 tape measure protein [Desulfobacteraceae bacterium]
MSNLNANITISVINRATEPIRKISQSLAGMRHTASPAIADVGKKLSNITRSVGALTGKLTLLGAALGYGFKTQFIDTASQFERFSTILKNVEGSSEKAKKSMEWVSDFAAKTPYELGEVMDAFVKLKAYGLDPQGGLMTNIGDAAAKTGKGFIQGVEAFADAVMAQNERLKEFSSITAETKGNKIRYSYTDKAGLQKYATVDKRNRKQIAETLSRIFAEQAGGAMDALSKTWEGMVSNLSDQWTRFKIKVMEAGLFDWMKGKLGDLLATINKMANNGDLERIATLWGTKIKTGMIEAWRIGGSLLVGLEKIKSATDAIASALGGYDKLLIGIASIFALKLAVQVGSLIVSLAKLGSVVLPVVGEAFTTLATVGGSAIASLLFALDPLIIALTALGLLFGGKYVLEQKAESEVKNSDTKKLKEELSRNNVMGGGPNTYRSKLIQGELNRRERPVDEKAVNEIINKNLANQKIFGELKIKIDSPTPVSISEIWSKNMHMDVDTGRTMQGQR